MEIRCKKEDCQYNTGCSCCAGNVIVDRAEHCESYAQNPIKNELIKQEGDIFHVADDMAKQHLKSVPLGCKSRECIYNKDERCRASGISIVDGDTCADCATYCKC